MEEKHRYTNRDSSDMADEVLEYMEKNRSFYRVLVRFAEKTSMGGVNYINSAKKTSAKLCWSVLLLLSIVAMSFHLWYLFDQYLDYPKTAKIELGFANLDFPEITICNINPVNLRRMQSADSNPKLDRLRELIDAFQPERLQPLYFNDFNAFYNYYLIPNYNYYSNFWNAFDPYTFYYNYYHYYYYPGYRGGGIFNPFAGSSWNPWDASFYSNDYYDNLYSDYNDFYNNYYSSNYDYYQSWWGRRKRYSGVYGDLFNFSAFDPDFQAWWDESHEETHNEEGHMEESDLLEKFQVLFKKTFVTLPKWERARLGHNITKMMLSCTFNRASCTRGGKDMFDLFPSADYGNCWTLNTTKYNFQGVDSGPNWGFSFILNMQTTDYLNITQGYGAVVHIHDRKTLPDPTNQGLFIPVGQETSIGLKLLTFDRLGGNYGDCEDGKIFEKRFNQRYTRRTCQLYCRAEVGLSRCHCYDEITENILTLTARQQSKICNTTTEFNCMFNLEKEFERKEINCACRTPCKENTYVKSVSSHQWPTEQHAELLVANVCIQRDNKACTSLRGASVKSRNFLKLNVYFEDLNFEQVVEYPDIELAQFASDFGGAIGLWIGLSLISLAEVVQLLIEMCGLIRHKMVQPRRQRRLAQIRGQVESQNKLPPHENEFERRYTFEKNGRQDHEAYRSPIPRKQPPQPHYYGPCSVFTISTERI